MEWNEHMTRINEYHKPPNLAEALALLGRSEPATYPAAARTSGAAAHGRRPSSTWRR